jgi:predicted enzyme related to lactoylglutathione lyase
MAIKARVVTLVPIKNMNRALRFYRNILGAKIGNRGRGAMKDMWASVKLAGADIWLISPEKQEKRTLAYTLLMVKNIRSAARALSKRGVRFARASRSGPQTKVEGPIAWEPFGGGAFFKDSEGNLLMLWQNIPPM